MTTGSDELDGRDVGRTAPDDRSEIDGPEVMVWLAAVESALVIAWGPLFNS